MKNKGKNEREEKKKLEGINNCFLLIAILLRENPFSSEDTSSTEEHLYAIE